MYSRRTTSSRLKKLRSSAKKECTNTVVLISAWVNGTWPSCRLYARARGALPPPGGVLSADARACAVSLSRHAPLLLR